MEKVLVSYTDREDEEDMGLSIEGLDSFSTLRVLLVESDDSTRMIVSALLKKCGYRVVAVADGIKAWETLKGKPYDTDLILSEVDLPSISGFVLLTMIMEHSICRNIPVIMMSSHDSMSLVFKCTSKGAADFLVKPLRKNELRNLWQHVWRKQSIIDFGKDISDVKKFDEAVHEDFYLTKHSGLEVEFISENNECSAKRSDSQNSCTKPGKETESTFIEELQELSHPKFRRILLRNGLPNVLKYGGCVINMDEKLLMDPKEDVASKSLDKNTKIRIEDTHGYKEDSKSSLEAIDFIGTFDNHLNAYSTYFEELLSDRSCSNNAATNTQLLELSLNRDDNELHQNNKRLRVNHSSTSAFSRYSNRSVQPQFEQLTSLHNDHEVFPCNGVQLNQYLVKGTTHLDFEQPGQSEAFSVQVDCVMADIDSKSSNRNESVEDLEYVNEFRHVSSLAAQSGTSSVCNSVISQRSSSGCASFCYGNEENPTPVGANSELVFIFDEKKIVDTFYSTHREAALAKFRMKRKDRCFDKKVRYHSRKRLAEQRPRVKGQFVRQIPS